MVEKELLIGKLLEVGALKFGDFTLSSGKKSRVYVDIKQASTHPDILRLIADGIAEIVKDIEFDRIACVELGGVPIAVALSLQMEKPLVIFRKERKEYGLGGDRIGTLEQGEKVIVVEDVVTTGKSALSAVRRVEDAGASVVSIVAVVDRGEGDLKVKSLLKLTDLLKAYDFRNTSES